MPYALIERNEQKKNKKKLFFCETDTRQRNLSKNPKSLLYKYI